MATRQPTAKAGKKLGRYRIVRELGRGGMGVVYLAQDENLDRLVALKTTSVAGLGSGEKARNQRRQRFIREVQALAQLSHENVVHVYDAGEEDDPDLGWLLFYSMQYVEGITLAQLVQRKGAMDPGAAAAVCAQVASGLGAGHRQGIVHRDVKPANIFLSYDGRALIGDFGIAKIEGSTQITRRDQLVGTPNYLAPEQILGENVSPATDVFALGALFYVIVTNRPLRTRLDAAALLQEAKGNASKEKMLAETGIPEGLRRVVARALEREPGKRYPDCAAFAEALSEHATRIPKLTDDVTEERAFPRDELPSFDTNPFASLPGGSAEDADDAGFSGVEAAAQALLAEVDQLNKKPTGQRSPPPAEPALPVARTESTVMFNLRAMEHEPGPSRPASAAPQPTSSDVMEPLPVARTESTVVFNLRAESDRPPSLPPQPPVTESSAPLSDVTQEVSFVRDEVDGVDEPTAPTAPVQPAPQPAVRTVDPDALAAQALPPLEREHVARIGMSAGAGALLAVVLLAFFHLVLGSSTPDIPRPDPGDSPTAFVGSPLESVGSANLPEHCSKASVSASNRQRAQQLVQEALRVESDKPSKARELLEEAVGRDPANVEAHYRLGKVRAAMQDFDGSKREYRCVIWLDPGSQYAAAALKAFEAR